MMVSLTRIVLFGGPLLLLVLIAIAGYGYSEILRLSLPISQVLALFAVLLPVATGLSFRSAYSLLQTHANSIGRARPTIYLLLLLASQLIYETVIATLALTYMAPPSSLSCGLGEQWQRLYSSNDGTAIKRIQDRFDCCGFKTVLDRAWPKDRGRCRDTYDRTQSCAGPWRQAQQTNAGLFLTVAAVIFVMKLGALTVYLNTSSAATATSIPWFRTSPTKRVTAGEVEDGRRLINEGEPHEEYHDDPDSENVRDGEPVAIRSNDNGKKSAIEPSGLHGVGEGWTSEH